MIRAESHGPVTRLRFATRGSRLLGYSVSAWVTRDVLVDTGCPGVERELAAWLRRRPVRGAMVTHHHEDHAGNVALLAELGVPIAAAPDTLDYSRRPASIRLYRRFAWGAPRPLHAPVVPFTDERLSLLAAPGHSPDHHVVWDAERGHLFGGDLFLGVKVRLAHPEEDPARLADSLRRMAALEPALLLDAHRGPVVHPAPLLRAKADWIEETAPTIAGLLARGVPEREIRRRVLGRESLEGYASRGEYSRLTLVRAVRRQRMDAASLDAGAARRHY
ncbi:MAG TPA: MBL fold metallo-hydrolase [Gemmatimonadaceae bacterium]|nr:MBL fold metallo-hydrolase [Gemmatimonadaceae bacterium]